MRRVLDRYKTVLQEAVDEYVVKKSRFLGYAKPVATQQEALDFIEKIKKRHWDATHNVYAYVLLEDGLRRFSDDGEPQGTAGMPALDVLLKEELCNVAVVCTRYFGGVMLGAGGLVRAYSHTAKIAVEAAKIITMARCVCAEVVCDYPFFGKLQPLLYAEGAELLDTAFSDTVRVTFRIEKTAFAHCNAEVVNASFGKAECVPFEEGFARIPEK